MSVCRCARAQEQRQVGHQINIWGSTGCHRKRAGSESSQVQSIALAIPRLITCVLYPFLVCWDMTLNAQAGLTVIKPKAFAGHKGLETQGDTHSHFALI